MISFVQSLDLKSLEYFKKEEKYYLEQAAKRLEEAKVKHRANNRAGTIKHLLLLFMTGSILKHVLRGSHAGGLYSYKMKVCYERADQRVRDFQISVHNDVRFSYCFLIFLF